MHKLAQSALIVALLYGGSAIPVSAEVLLLKTGGRVEGEWLNPDREAADAYRFRLPAGLDVSVASLPL